MQSAQHSQPSSQTKQQQRVAKLDCRLRISRYFNFIHWILNLPGAEAALTTALALVFRRGRLLVLHLIIGISDRFLNSQMNSTYLALGRVAALLGRVAVALLGRVTLLVTALGRVTAVAVSKSQVSKMRIANCGVQSCEARRSP